MHDLRALWCEKRIQMPRQAFFSVRIGVLTDIGLEILDSHYGFLQKKEWRPRRGPVCRTLLPVDPEFGRDLRRAKVASSPPGDFTRLRFDSSILVSTWRGESRIATSRVGSSEGFLCSRTAWARVLTRERLGFFRHARPEGQ